MAVSFGENPADELLRNQKLRKHSCQTRLRL